MSKTEMKWIGKLIKRIGRLQSQLVKANEENERLREFARYVIRVECWSIFEQDGEDIQKLAEKLGLIIPYTAASEDVDEESNFGIGDIIYKFSETLKEHEHGCEGKSISGENPD